MLLIMPAAAIAIVIALVLLLQSARQRQRRRLSRAKRNEDYAERQSTWRSYFDSNEAHRARQPADQRDPEDWS